MIVLVRSTLFFTLVFAAFLLQSGQTFAHHGSFPIQTDHIESFVLGKHLYTLEDAEGTLLLEDILSDELQQQFEPMFVEPPYLG
ncbi:MAG: hypothetical protein MI808_08280, partial [Pseudomonadales bacterium]|nr:hypothetical protein [Pseudomonadales bacterium]